MKTVLTQRWAIMTLKSYIIVCLSVFIVMFNSCARKDISVIPKRSRQLLILLTDSVTASKGILYRFERKTKTDQWIQTKPGIPAVLGENGLAWGLGLHDSDIPGTPSKKEGDGCSPAGIFTLSKVYGYTRSDSMKDLHMLYRQINERTECIDDMNSRFYTRIINVDKNYQKDWNSSEKMGAYGIYYAQVVTVNHNIDAVPGAGSCIFIHNWKTPNEVTSGCTELAPENLHDIIRWLDVYRVPLIVQLPKSWYKQVESSWKLPPLETWEQRPGDQ